MHSLCLVSGRQIRWPRHFFYRQDDVADEVFFFITGKAGKYIDKSSLPISLLLAGTFFGVSPAESSATDPQQRLLLEYGYSSLHAAHERRETLRGADIGVFLGIMNADFNAMFIENDSVYAATGGTISIAAGRLSFAVAALRQLCVGKC